MADSTLRNFLLDYIQRIGTELIDEEGKIAPQKVFQALVRMAGSEANLNAQLEKAGLRLEELKLKGATTERINADKFRNQVEVERVKAEGRLGLTRARLESTVEQMEAKERIKVARAERTATEKRDAANRAMKEIRRLRSDPQNPAVTAAIGIVGEHDPIKAAFLTQQFERRTAKIAKAEELAREAKAVKLQEGRPWLTLERATELTKLTPAKRTAQLAADLAEAQKGRLMKGGLYAGLAAIGIPLMAKMVFGGKKEAAPELSPEVQMMMMQQMAGQQQGGVDTSRTLRDMAKLLTTLKQLQDMAGVMPGGPQMQAMI